MKEYTVKQISEILNTNPETIRRWIRTGKLTATQISKKNGNVISEESLRLFLESAPKYAALAGGVVAAPLLVFSAGLMAGNIVSILSRNTDKGAHADIRQRIGEQMKNSEDTIAKKESLIQQLQQEINEEQAKVEIMKQVLKSGEQTVIPNE